MQNIKQTQYCNKSSEGFNNGPHSKKKISEREITIRIFYLKKLKLRSVK